MLPNKYGYWYLIGIVPASILGFLPLIGDFIGFFISAIVITAIIYNKTRKKFKSQEIFEIAVTCSFTMFVLGIMFFVIFMQQLTESLFYLLSGALITRFIAISGGIWVFNELIR